MSVQVEIFKDVIKHEADTLMNLLTEVNDLSIEKAIDVFTHCTGRIVCIGVGKSGIIAKKISATLSSLGIRSIPMHASDALHGDIGIISDDDAALILSNSGTTEEIIALLPHLKLRRIPCIAIVGNSESRLARDSDIVLETRVNREADSLNLAPTASTTAQLAIGDALAVAASTLKGITPKDFALNHPAGRLGKQLTLTVGDLMLRGAENPLVDKKAPLKILIESIARYQAGAVTVVDTEGVVSGIVTDGDLRRALQNKPTDTWHHLGVEEIMTVKPTTVPPEILAVDALRIMEKRKSEISVIPVIDPENRPIGMIRIHDIIKSGL